MPSLPLTVVQQFHPDVYSWLNRVRQSGGSIPEYGVYAHNRFVNRLVDNGLWQKLKQGNGLILTFGTSDFSGSIVPFLAPHGITVTNNNFVSGDYSPSTGLNPGRPNTSKYLDLGYNPSNWLTTTSASLSFYSRTDALADSGESFGYPTTHGCKEAFTGESDFYLSVGNVEDNITSSIFGGYDATTLTAYTGLLTASRISFTDLRLYQNGAQVGITDTTDISGFGFLPDVNAFGFLMNENNGLSLLFDFKICGYMTILPGLTPAEEAIHYAAVQELQTAYARAV